LILKGELSCQFWLRIGNSLPSTLEPQDASVSGKIRQRLLHVQAFYWLKSKILEGGGMRRTPLDLTLLIDSGQPLEKPSLEAKLQQPSAGS
jgi:hypothetical protein